VFVQYGEYLNNRMDKAVIRKDSVREESDSEFSNPATSIYRYLQEIYIVICKKPAVIVGLQPMVEMKLVKVRTHEFFTQFMRLAVNERHLITSRRCG
jgi:hypothetical protein